MNSRGTWAKLKAGRCSGGMSWEWIYVPHHANDVTQQIRSSRLERQASLKRHFVRWSQCVDRSIRSRGSHSPLVNDAGDRLTAVILTHYFIPVRSAQCYDSYIYSSAITALNKSYSVSVKPSVKQWPFPTLFNQKTPFPENIGLCQIFLSYFLYFR